MSILSTSPPAVRAREEPSVEAWQTELRAAIRDPRQLCAALGLPAELAEQGRAAAADFPCFVPPAYLARIQRGNPADPLLRQVLPAVDEGREAAGFVADPVAEAAAIQAPGLLQKYPGRALLVATSACPVHCRYCFRRHFPYTDHAAGDAAWGPAVDALRADPSIEEVILSGGDPLTVTDRRLAALVEQLAALPHVVRLRIHTRMPVMIPSRVTPALLDWLTGSRLTPVLVLHANHARELDGDVAAAVDRLRRGGVMLLNQAGLLAGGNDSVDEQCALSRRLTAIGVVPYYLHQLDRVCGAAHFEVPVPQGREIVAEMRRRLPGYAVPTYVQEVPGELHKAVL
ncbi:MAG TPA: EF-P beta-lysylation protein EpmB [Lacipirellulaceae bacterium]|nr:EF-P beta-lysylation protein EpmB [Lacipirellulaceae bacterium]